MTPLGWPTYYTEDYAAQAQAFQAALSSLVCEGVFTKFPDLKVVLIESGFGWHLVFVDSLMPGRVPEFVEVESEVKSEWIKDQRAEFKRKAYEAMKARYEIVLPTEQAIEAACSGKPASGVTANSTPGDQPGTTNDAPAWMGGL